VLDLVDLCSKQLLQQQQETKMIRCIGVSSHSSTKANNNFLRGPATGSFVVKQPRIQTVQFIQTSLSRGNVTQTRTFFVSQGVLLALCDKDLSVSLHVLGEEL
jgi:hypothetical protein